MQIGVVRLFIVVQNESVRCFFLIEHILFLAGKYNGPIRVF